MSAAVNNGNAGEEEQQIIKNEVAVVEPERIIKHPLNSTWCLWYFINDKNIKWEDCQVKVATFNTVEDFWSIFNHIESASKLKMGCDYSLFKEGITPMWEDKANYNGGRWSLNVQRAQRSSDLDHLWLELVMMIVGEACDDDINDDISGAVVSVRPRGDRIALWTRTAKDQDLCVRIGKSLKAALDVPPNVSIDYNLHTDTSVKRSSTVRATYSV